MAFVPDAIPVHSLPKTPSQVPALKIFRFKNSEGKLRESPVSLPITPLPTDTPHRHTYYEILFIEEGAGFHEIDFHSYNIQGAGLHFLTPGQVHLLTFSTSFQGYIVAFSEDFYTFYNPVSPSLSQLPFFQPARKQPIITLSEAEKRYFHNILENMVSDHLASETDQTMIGKYLGLILQKCAFLAPKNIQPAESAVQTVPELVGRFQELVEKNFRQMHEVQQYAQELSVSPDYLSKIIKKYLGTPSQEYILDKLLLEAKRLLVFTNLSSKEIGYHIHMDDPSYFSRIFKKKTGLTPNEYRDHVRKSTI
ncbi:MULTISPECIES: helix-turn-helix domain-containing protein [Dyadobacter]|uniref:AraC family transcriptional regulator n=1 Tax=Dyadobacter chenhuakuii TaxID=2909339 RepID=A0ABY4XEN8_9BACT|nr:MULTISPECIES: AraC family transcriptional regulator [Dyadobacter]MCE7069644.1 AraC family transcriptional regulator [Dyadobacter sp. CY327]MCF2491969.1 AraC family transcriptional regulator [Dyadobacter chenhuakuii]USJ28870.1 AraC family transcriptional regulator [Dyadobacter chenhuakuii]